MNKRNGSRRPAILWCVPLLLLLPARGWGQEADALTVTDQHYVDAEAQYYDLGCEGRAWVGYFARERWQKSGADEGRCSPAGTRLTDENVLFGSPREQAVSWTIELPADGYLSFRLQPVSSGAMAAVRVLVNGHPLPEGVAADGIFYSPFLRMGDEFTLVIPAGGVRYYWSDLLFHSNYTGVVVRPGEHLPRRRFQPVAGSKIDRVSFSDHAGSWPVYDADGDEMTLDDRYEIRDDTDLFELSYSDEVKWDAATGHPVLERTFVIREVCMRGNVLWKTVTWSALPMLPKR